MTEPDLTKVGKLFVVTGAGMNAMYFLKQGRERPTREGGYEGGLIPDPQPYNTAEKVSFYVGDMTIRWLLLKFVILPIMAVWVAAVMLFPMYLMSTHTTTAPCVFDATSVCATDHFHLAAPGIIWLIVTAFIGFRILRRIFRAIDGRKVKRQAPAVVTAAVAVRPQLPPPRYPA